jgi:hypothetical protein
MISVMPMTVETLSLFVMASGALAIAPGPDNNFVLIQSAMHGQLADLFVTFGLCTGLLFHTGAVAIGMPYAAKIFFFRRLLANLDDFRICRHALDEWVGADLAEAPGKGNLLPGRQDLIAKENDQMFQKSAVNFCVGFSFQMREIDAVYHRADGAGNRMNSNPLVLDWRLSTDILKTTLKFASSGAYPLRNCRAVRTDTPGRPVRKDCSTRARVWSPAVTGANSGGLSGP